MEWGRTLEGEKTLLNSDHVVVCAKTTFDILRGFYDPVVIQ